MLHSYAMSCNDNDTVKTQESPWKLVMSDKNKINFIDTKSELSVYREGMIESIHG